MVVQVETGQAHMVALTDKGDVYSWGLGKNGRLGLGTDVRVGVEAPANKFFPSPGIVVGLRGIRVRQVSCAPAHSVAVSDGGVFSWGEGSGGRLGLGDHLDRSEPALIPRLANELVLSVACGYWHTCALVAVSPMLGAGTTTGSSSTHSLC